MSRRRLSFPVTGNEADYALTFGEDECILEVCRYRREDLTLLEFRASQVVRLKDAEPFRERSILTPSCCSRTCLHVAGG
jgi:hypothetical protein